MSRKLGYARERTINKAEIQVSELERYGCKKEFIFIDIITRRNALKPSLANCLSIIEPGDTFVVTSFDRIGMTTLYLINFLENLLKRGINIKSISDKLIGISPSERKVLKEFIDALINNQHMINKENSKYLNICAKARGRMGGRKPLDPNMPLVKEAKRLYNENNHSTKEICYKLGISKTSFYKYISLGK
jgi:DNA invertase Pin-like site-specific DNA recombinase